MVAAFTVDFHTGFISNYANMAITPHLPPQAAYFLLMLDVLEIYFYD